MLDDPLDQYEEIIVAQLESYQSQLDLGTAGSSELDESTDIPAELQPHLNDFRRCLDLIGIHKDRIRNELPSTTLPPDSVISDHATRFRIGRFEVADQLGVGGFGIVFLGFDPVVGRNVAIKVPRPEFLGSPELTDRFAREATAVAQLEHPNIVPVFESDCFEIVPYIVMPYIAGQTLAQWRAEQSNVSPRKAAEIVRQLANAVAHAHERGVLHRDLKPGNVLLAQRESVAVGDELAFVPKLTDFGLAKCTNAGGSDTRTGAIMGTASYMSPEQVEGRTRDITSRSDIYGLGVILYELLIGAPPFHDTNQLRTIQKVLQDEPPSFRSCRITIPSDLEVICLKCLEKSPLKRYASAGALADDLQSFLNGEPIQARPIRWSARLAKWIRRRPVHATFIMAMLLGVLSIAGVSLRYNDLLNSMHNVAESERRSRHETEMISKRRAYVSDMRNAKLIGDHNNISQMLTLLDRYTLKPGEPDFRDFAWWHLTREYQESSQVLGRHEKGATSVAITRDGNLAASGGKDGVVRIWTLPTGKLVREITGHLTGAVESVQFSPKGDRLVSAGEDGTIRTWDTATFESVFVGDVHRSSVYDARFSPNGDVIASCGADHQVRLWDSSTGEQLGVLSGHSDPVHCLAFHPTEEILVSGGKDAKICFWDWKHRCPDPRIVGGAIQLPSQTQWPRTFAFEPDGRALEVGATNSMIFRYSLQPGQYGSETHRRSANGNPNCLAWPRNGPLISALGNSEIHIADRLDPSLPGEWKRGHQQSVVSVSVSEDGSSMVSASADGEVRYWPDFQNYSRINIARDKGASWVDEHRVYDVQWRNQYLAADFQQRDVALYQMPERKLKRTIAKADDDGFVLSTSGNLLLTFKMNGLVTCYRTNVEQPLWTQNLPPRQTPFFPEFSVIDEADNIAIVAWDDDLLVLSMQSPQILRRFHHPHRVWQVAFTVDQYELAVPVSACHDGYIRFWDLGYARLLDSFHANHGPTYSVAVSSDRQLLATAGEDYTVRIWRYRNLEPVVVLPSSERPGPSRIGFLKGLNGSEILVRQNIQLSLWGIHEEAELLVFPDCGQFGSLSISPDRKQLAVPQHGWVRLIDGRRTFQLTDGRIEY